MCVCGGWKVIDRTVWEYIIWGLGRASYSHLIIPVNWDRIFENRVLYRRMDWFPLISISTKA